MLRVGSGNQIIYSTSVAASPTFVGDLIILSPNDTTVHVNLGAFQLNALSTTIPIQLPWLLQGSTVPIPDTTVNVADVSDTISTFQSVSFESGSISLTIENNLPVALEVVNPVELRDDQNNLVVTFVFNPSTIPPNSSRTATDDLADKTITNVIHLSGLTLHITGSQTPVPIPSGDLIVATLATNDVEASQAVFAEIPPQIITNNDTTNLNLDDSTIVKEARFQSGTLNLRFTNTVSLDILFKYRLSELQQWIGGMYVPYEDSISLSAMSTDSISINLADSKIQSQTGDLVRSLELVSTIGFPTGSTQPVTVRATDKVLISVSSDDAIIVDSAVAVLKPTWVNVNTAIGIDFGEWPTRFAGQLNIPAATLNLNTVSTIGFPADLYLKIGAVNAAGDSIFLQVPA
ncbi:MAG: hypothetical protein O7D34_02845, partial [Ignavibacteria bacterium]|nr:hypothetical protein [Ignavibacteria bacterium]